VRGRMARRCRGVRDGVARGRSSLSSFSFSSSQRAPFQADTGLRCGERAQKFLPRVKAVVVPARPRRAPRRAPHPARPVPQGTRPDPRVVEPPVVAVGIVRRPLRPHALEPGAGQAARVAVVAVPGPEPDDGEGVV